MPNILWRKILRDLWTNELRTLLAILSIAVGIVGVGSILSTYAILTREIDANFANTNPASAVLYVEGADPELAEAVEALPGVADADVRRVLRGRLQAGPDLWKPITLFVIDDFDALEVATFRREAGTRPQGNQEILVERSSVSIAELQPSANITLHTPNGPLSELTVSGVVFDAARAPGWQDRIDYGYINLETLKNLGETGVFNQLLLTVADAPMDVDHITDIAYQVKETVEAGGYQVSLVSIPTPGEHPHTDQMNSLLFLLQTFGVLTLVLSGILVANIISAMLAQQIRQIGAMKAVGARTRQVTSIYFRTVLIYGIAALAIGIPIANAAGRTYAEFTGKLLNFDITSDFIPPWVFALQVMVGLLIPLVSAAVPILRGSAVTVREAVSNYGLSAAQYGQGVVDRVISRLRGLNGLTLLSIRNTFRRRMRLVLIVAILAAGGATFISAIAVNQSWLNTIDVAFDARRYDFKIDLVEPLQTEFVENSLSTVPGVTQLESWQESIAVQQAANGLDGIQFRLTGVPADTSMIDFPLLEGRWLRPGDTNAMVINHELSYDEHVALKTGDTITTRVGGETISWEIVGVVREIGAPRRGLGLPVSAYVNLNYLANMTGMEGMTTTLRIQAEHHSQQAIREVNQNLERQMKLTGIRPYDLQTTIERRIILEEHMVVILVFLLIMAGMVASVGGMALASVISINVMERKREIGILRAVGASTWSVLRVFLGEALLVGLISWFVAITITGPLGKAVGDFAGWIFIRSPLESVFPTGAMFAWLILIVGISLGASFYPAWSATKLSVREVVEYE